MTETTQTHEDAVLEMARLGVLFGHIKSKTHPRMKPYIGATKNEMELIDPDATLAALATAIEVVRSVFEKGGTILCVGTTASARTAVDAFARRFGFPHVTGRWLGGTLTNFSVISARVKHLLDMQEKQATGALAKYTKKEQLKFTEEIGKMAQTFRGLEGFMKLPALLFIVDAKTHAIAIKEAKKLNIPVVAVLDTDDDPRTVEYPIFANDHAKSSIAWVVERVTDALIPVAESVAAQAGKPATV